MRFLNTYGHNTFSLFYGWNVSFRDNRTVFISPYDSTGQVPPIAFRTDNNHRGIREVLGPTIGQTPFDTVSLIGIANEFLKYRVPGIHADKEGRILEIYLGATEGRGSLVRVLLSTGKYQWFVSRKSPFREIRE